MQVVHHCRPSAAKTQPRAPKPHRKCHRVERQAGLWAVYDVDVRAQDRKELVALFAAEQDAERLARLLNARRCGPATFGQPRTGGRWDDVEDVE